MAQELIDLGVLTAPRAPPHPLARTLSSSLGGHQSDPVVTRFDMTWGTVVLLCSDGLTDPRRRTTGSASGCAR